MFQKRILFSSLPNLRTKLLWYLFGAQTHQSYIELKRLIFYSALSASHMYVLFTSF